MNILSKYISSIVTIVLFTTAVIAQQENNTSQKSKMNAAAKMFILEYENVLNSSRSDAFSKLKTDYDLIKKDNQLYIGVLALVNTDEIDENALNQLGVINDTRLNQLWTMRVPIEHFSSLTNVSGIKFIEVAEPVSEFLHIAVTDTKADSVHAGFGGLANGYTGKGVVIAIIDWGFDYTHPVFYDTTLTDLRLSRAWDQNKTVGTPPSGYSFGTEYVGQNALLAAQHDTNYVFGYSSHGSHVAGIAGGSGGGTAYLGAAPDAELIFISLRRDAPSLIDGFNYVKEYAESVNKPCVFNMSFGSHLGPHDGTSMKNIGIDNLHDSGVIFVGSAGNNGTPTNNFHLDHNFSETPTDTLRTVVNFANEPEQFGQTLSMWGSANSDFAVSLLLVNSSNLSDTIHFMPFHSSLDEPTFIDTILLNNDDTLIVRMLSVSEAPVNLKPNIRMEVKNTSSHRVVLQAISSNTHLHIWNNVRMNNRYTNWGVPLTNNYPGAVSGDNDYGLGEPAGVGKNVITVGSYRAEFLTPNGNLMYGQLSNFSSKGPTVDERVKPDISSTGQVVRSSVNSFDTTQTQIDEIEFNGRTYGFASFSGTSMSAPMVTGIVALMLEANPTLNVNDLKYILKTTARLDDKTGEIGPEGHLQWGWGKANALAAVIAAETFISSVNEIEIAEDFFDVYPNPASGVLNITLHDGLNGEIQQVELFQIDGKENKLIAGKSSEKITVNVSDLPNGMYIVKVQTKNKFAMKKIIISH